MTVKLRDEEFDGVLSFGKAFRHILHVYFYGSIISSLVIFIYSSFINPQFMDVLFQSVLKLYHYFKFPIDENNYKVLENIFKPATYAIWNIIGSIIIGSFWGLILAGLAKKEKNIFE